MNSERYNRGLQKLIELEGDIGKKVVAMMDAISPDFTQYLVEFVFGDIYSRPGLDLKTKEVIALASMATLGNAPLQVKVHIHAAMNLGCSEHDIIELLLQLIPQCGMAVPMNALLIAKEVFEERRKGTAPS
jgi:4-carboxymuconolactone decarboxylase